MENKPAALSISDAARFLGLGRTKLYELIGNGDLPIVRLGGRTLIRRADAEALLDSRVVVSVPKSVGR